MSIKLIVGYILGIIILIAIIIYAGSRGTTTTASKDDPNRPIAIIQGASSFDLGKMTNRDIRSKTFEIKNNGKNDLELINVATSCDCTYVYVTTNGQKSPKFTMHGTTDWKGIIKSGEKAQIEVIYEPAIMPVNGMVERIVTITTNDPEHQSLEFKVQAEVFAN